MADESSLETEGEPETAEAVEDDDIPFDGAAAAAQAIAAQVASQTQSKASTGTLAAPAPESKPAGNKRTPRF